MNNGARHLRRLIDIDWSWATQAECKDVDVEVFYGETHAEHLVALAYCQDCPVSHECLDAAMSTESSSNGFRHGVWGGTTPKQRRAIAKRRGKKVAA
jgi:WhiB family transcriptional regulator, redox-sensing transcriptional regulator